MYRSSKDYTNLYKREDPIVSSQENFIFSQVEPFIKPSNVLNPVANPIKAKITTNMKCETVEGNISDPKIWGPSFWFTLHNGANNYPKEASKIVIEKMKGFIIGLPYMIVCKECSTHAQEHIESKMNELDKICSGRTSLFNFFVDFHNYVNKRYNKPLLSYEEAEKIYSHNTKVFKMSYS